MVDVSKEDSEKAQAALDALDPDYAANNSSAANPGVEQSVQAPVDTNKPYVAPPQLAGGDPAANFTAARNAGVPYNPYVTPDGVVPTAPIDLSKDPGTLRGVGGETSKPDELVPQPQTNSNASPAQSLLTPKQIREQDLKAREPLYNSQIDSYDKARVAMETAAKTADQTAKDTSFYRQAEAQEMAKREAARTVAVQMANTRAAAIDARIQQHIDSIKEVDPDNRSIPAKVLGAIGMALGAYGAGITHSHNFAMEIINADIKNRVDAQKANIEKEWKKVAQENHLADTDKNRNDFTIEQYSRAEQMQHQLYADKITDLAAQSGNAYAQAQAAQLVAGLNDKVTAIKSDRQDRMTNSLMSNYHEAATAQANQNARAIALDKQVGELAGKLLSEGTYTNPQEARAAAAASLGIGNFSGSSNGKNGENVIDANTGKPRKAVSKDQGEMYDKSVPAFQKILGNVGELRAAIDRGDTAAQEQLTGIMKDAIPQLSGVTRLPSMGQLEKVLPEVLPSPIGNVRGAIPSRETGSWTEQKTVELQKLDRLEKMLKESRSELDTQTFGAPNGVGVTPGRPQR